MGAFEKAIQALKKAFRGGGRAYSVKKHAKVSEMFSAGPSQIAAAIRGTYNGDWDAYHDLCGIFDRFLVDGHLLAEYEKRRNTAIKWPFEIEASAADPQGDAIADELRADFENFSRFRRRVLYELSDAIAKGFSAVELLGEYDKKTNRLVLTSAAGVPQYALKQDAATGGWQFKDDSGDWVDVPVGKLLIYDRPAKGSILLGGLMMPLIWLTLFKNFTVRDWVAFLEVYGVPLRIGRYPAHFSEESPEVETLTRAVLDIASDAGVVIPEGMKIEFIESARKGTSAAFREFAEFCNKEISKVVVAGTLTSDAGEKSTEAQADGHADALDDVGAADAEDLGEALSELLKMLVILNHGERPGYPKFVFNTSTITKQTKRLFVLQGAANAGVPIGVEQAWRELSIDPVEDGDRILGPSGTMQNPTGGDVAPQPTVAEAYQAGSSRITKAEARLLAELPATASGDKNADDFVAAQADVGARRFAEIIDTWIDAAAARFSGDMEASLTQLETSLAASLHDAVAGALLASLALTAAENERRLQPGETVDRDRLFDEWLSAIAASAGSFMAHADARPEGFTPPLLHAERVTSAAAILFDFDTPAIDLELNADGLIEWHAVRPQEAINYWKKVTGVTPAQFERLSTAARQYAFTITGRTGKTGRAFIDAARDEIGRAIEEGKTARHFAREMRDVARRQGVAPLENWRAALVFRQNTATAYSAGRLAVQRSPEMLRTFPMLQYHAVRDSRTRLSHRQLEGTVQPADSDFWAKYYPPWAWACRCWVSSERSQTAVNPINYPPVDPAFSEKNPLSFWRTSAGLDNAA